MTETFQFSRNSRTPRMIATLGILYGVLMCAYLTLDAALWVVTLLALPTLPAVWDCWRNTRLGLSLGPVQLKWHSGKHTNTVPLEQIYHASFDTRFDFSVRVIFFLQNGKKLYLPPQVLPPGRQLETELQKHGIRTERHHFRLFRQ